MQEAAKMQEAIRFLAAPTTDKAGGKSVDEAVEEERRWVEGLSRVPSAKLLVQHFCAFDSIIRSGGQHGVEPASDQVSTWRRMFCWQLKQSDAPFGIKGENGRLPKCVAMCNLSGQHAFYYCETFSLARILCLVPQDSHMRVIVGVSKVIAKASELGASLWAGFCLPFQVGLDRCYWEVRTVRKTSAGKVRDGELAFGSEDAEPRTMGCTEDSEHWSDAMLSELCKKMLKVVSPACIDIQDDHDVSMTPERMELAIKILKTDRKKTQELHRETVEGIRDTYSAIVQDLEKKAANAEEEANTRVSGVLKTAQAAKSAAESKINELQQHVSTLSAQLASQRNAAEDAKSRMAGMMLKHEEENVTRAARQKTLEAQIASMSSNHARQVAENSKRLKETAKSHEVAMAALKQNLADSQKKVKALTSATQAMNASVKEAHCSSALLSKKLRVMRCVVELGGLRFSDLQKQVAELETTETEVKKDLDVLRTRMKDMVKRSTVDPEASTDTAISSMRTTDADSCKVRPPANMLSSASSRQQDISSKEHLISELTKRCKLLETRILEVDNEKKHKFVADTRHPPKHNPNDDSGLPAPQTNTVNFSQNTAFYMQAPHQQAFPQGPYTVDPALEHTISQLHSALNFITSAARASGAASRTAELNQAKLDALYGTGYCDPYHCNAYAFNPYP